MAFAKFQENRFRIDGEIAENHAILVNLTESRLSDRHQTDVELTDLACLTLAVWASVGRSAS